MENLLGIHGNKTIKNFSKDNNKNDIKHKSKACSKAIKRIENVKNKENIAIVIIFAIVSILFLISFFKTYNNYKLIVSKHESIYNSIINLDNFSNSTI